VGKRNPIKPIWIVLIRHPNISTRDSCVADARCLWDVESVTAELAARYDVDVSCSF